MTTFQYDNESDSHDRQAESQADREFKKLKRPIHAAKRSKTPERLRGMHRRRRKRIEW
ncbi:MAG: hypothetical protein KDA92_01955 [Planctomycetales bacterium]|nr:hypothetical protein [Planctomycetales bacterium]